MNYPNENMEEFFRKSLDKFDSEPSNQVWQDIESRLDKDDVSGFPFKKLMALLPYLLLLTAFSVIYLHQSSKLDEYKSQLTAIVSENMNFRKELENYAGYSKISQDVGPISESESKQQETHKFVAERIRDTIYIVTRSQTNSIQSASKIDRDSQLKHMSGAFTSLSPYLLSGVSARGNDNSMAYTDINSLSNRNPLGTARKSLFGRKHSIAIANQGHQSFSNPYLSDNNYRDSPEAYHNSFVAGNQMIAMLPTRYRSSETLSSISLNAPFFPSMRTDFSKARDRKRKKQKSPKGPVLVNELDPWGEPGFYYRIGPSLNLQNTIVRNSFSYANTGLGYGFTQEVGFSDRFAIQSGLFRTIQEYTLHNDGLPFESQQISNYPDQINYDSEITSIDVENHLWDFPVGLKYDFYQDNYKSFFVIPGINWSIHSPQEFTYFLTDNRLTTYSSSLRFGYLNAFSFAFGIEKSISPSLAYQFILGYGKSLEPVGLEKEHLNSFNLKCNFLFGKK